MLYTPAYRISNILPLREPSRSLLHSQALVPLPRPGHVWDLSLQSLIEKDSLRRLRKRIRWICGLAKLLYCSGVSSYSEPVASKVLVLPWPSSFSQPPKCRHRLSWELSPHFPKHGIPLIRVSLELNMSRHCHRVGSRLRGKRRCRRQREGREAHRGALPWLDSGRGSRHVG